MWLKHMETLLSLSNQSKHLVIMLSGNWRFVSNSLRLQLVRVNLPWLWLSSTSLVGRRRNILTAAPQFSNSLKMSTEFRWTPTTDPLWSCASKLSIQFVTITTLLFIHYYNHEFIIQLVETCVLLLRCGLVVNFWYFQTANISSVLHFMLPISHNHTSFVVMALDVLVCSSPFMLNWNDSRLKELLMSFSLSSLPVNRGRGSLTVQ